MSGETYTTKFLGAGTASSLFGGLSTSGISGITQPLSTSANLFLSYSAAVILKCISFPDSLILVIIYSFAEPVTAAPVACCPVIAYITSAPGAELKALLTVTDVELKDEIGFVSTL